MTTSTILKRVARPWPARTVAFVDLAAGMFLHENGHLIQCHQAPIDLTKLLQIISWRKWDKDVPRVVYIVGGWVPVPETLPSKEWFHTTGNDGWELVRYHRDPLSVDYQHITTGCKVRLHSTAQWFDDERDITTCRRAFLRLRQMLRSSFDQGVSLMGTPARTGLDLIERSLPCMKDGTPYGYPVLADAVRERLEHNIGQGRMEWFYHNDLADTGVIYALDARWMYAACLRNLPAPPIEHDTVNELADGGYRAGFYRVRFQVPDDWQHIGLLPVWEGVPSWPHDPGYTGEAYCCGEELRLALEYGWCVEIVERWLFASERATNADPLRSWSEKLRALRARSTPEREGDLAEPLAAAIRAICNKAIGGLHRRGRYELVETPVDQADQLPEEAIYNLDEDAYGDGSVVRWWKSIPLDRSMLHFQHPEWAALIWGRARARLARAALKLPFNTILALRTDEIVMTMPVDWPDDGKPGTFRMKDAPICLNGLPYPENEQQFLRMRREVRNG